MFVKSMLLTFFNINSVLALMLLRSTGGSQFILDAIDCGYRIPFHCIPPVSFSSNNIGPHWHIPILRMKLFPNCWLPFALSKQRFFLIISTPLSISVKSSWRKRKILDLRFLRVKFEDLKVALNY